MRYGTLITSKIAKSVLVRINEVQALENDVKELNLIYLEEGVYLISKILPANFND
jgi:hypothetical protein